MASVDAWCNKKPSMVHVLFLLDSAYQCTDPRQISLILSETNHFFKRIQTQSELNVSRETCYRLHGGDRSHLFVNTK